MGLWRVLEGVPERFEVLREPCGACLGDHFGSKDGPRPSRFHRTLLVSVEVVVWFENLLFGVLLFVLSSLPLGATTSHE